SQFLLWALLSVNFTNTDLLREVTHFRFAISGKNHNALELMFRSQVLNERLTFGSRRIAKPKGCDDFSVDYDYAFQSPRDCGQVLAAGGVTEFTATGDSHLPARYRSSQTL